MTRHNKDAYRNIQLLCQGCHGVLVSLGEDRNENPQFHCYNCTSDWTYTTAGWQPFLSPDSSAAEVVSCD